ncbi:hypothetical protein [Paenibacillus gorillae]|uniref:hypothetical protein n=1 Tax=Paenibacillus gorillae TaxID=1243662 RepID=UPI0012DE6E0E|nr:hypothetical protein [Paenibacillus gorillae]
MGLIELKGYDKLTFTQSNQQAPSSLMGATQAQVLDWARYFNANPTERVRLILYPYVVPLEQLPPDRRPIKPLSEPEDVYKSFTADIPSCFFKWTLAIINFGPYVSAVAINPVGISPDGQQVDTWISLVGAPAPIRQPVHITRFLFVNPC